MRGQREVLAIARRLEKEYGRPQRGRLPALDELILTILSQNTNDANSGRAFQALRGRFPDWPSVAHSSLEEVEEAIRPGGLSKIKAARIQQILGRLEGERGEMDLGFLSCLGPDQAWKYLLSLPGVGPKTASCVLLLSLGMPAFPVDTHVLRVAKRLGLLGRETSPEQAHAILTQLVPPEEMLSFHLNLVTHGRRVCLARRPACPRCPLLPLCPRIGVDGN